MNDLGLVVSSRIDRSPYFEATLAAGATVFTVYNHMYMPSSYGDPEGEYRRLTQTASMWDVAAQRQVEVSGPDAAVFVDSLTCRDLSALDIGRARYAPMCDHHGLLINDPVILRVAADRWWISIADADIDLWCRAVAGATGASVEISLPNVAPLAVQGPAAGSVVESLFGRHVASIERFRFVETEFDGIPLWLGRAGWSGQGGFELYLTDPTRGTDLWDSVADAGRPYGIGPGAPNQGERIESGLLSFRTDTGTDLDPFEAGLGRWVGEGDFIGRDALMRRQTRLHRRAVVTVVFESGVVPPEVLPSPTDDGGELRTAVWSPKVERHVGVAVVDSRRTTPGTVVSALDDASSGPWRATVAVTPLG